MIEIYGRPETLQITYKTYSSRNLSDAVHKSYLKI